MDIELIDHSHRYVIDHVVEILWIVVESRHRRKNHHAHARQFQHVLQMYFIERRLTYDQNELSLFLQDHVSSTVNQVVAKAMRDCSQRAHAARRDHHSQRYKRAARDRCALRADTVSLSCEALYVLRGVWGFMSKRASCPLAHDQMRFDT